MAFKIEKGIPIPPPKGKRSGIDPNEFPFDEMEPGDSFLIPTETRNPWIGRMIKRWAEENDADVRARAERAADGGMAGYRVWLVSKAQKKKGR
jgi:hypothetical protein